MDHNRQGSQFQDRVHVGFQYPEEEIHDEAEYQKRLCEVINFIISKVITSRNPKAYVFGIAYAIGLDLTSVVPSLRGNTTRDYAKALGICQKSFQNHVRKAREALNLT